MNNVPKEIQQIICEYLFKCNKDKNYIVNKDFLNIYENLTKDCSKIELLGKKLCNKCDKSKIIKCRMIINNLLPN